MEKLSRKAALEHMKGMDEYKLEAEPVKGCKFKRV